MELLLKRLDELEKRIHILENGNNSNVVSNEITDFKDTIKLIKITNDNLLNIFNTSLTDEFIKIIIELNKITPFLQYKKHVFKLENNVLTKMEDNDYKYLFEYVEYLIIKEFNVYSSQLKSDDFFEKNKIIYGLKIDKNFKKIKSLFLQAL
jgi:hypothetical protein